MPELLPGTLVVESPIALGFLLILPVLVAALLRWSKPGGALWAALTLRTVATVLVVLAVAGLALESRTPANDLCIVVAADLSESVGADGAETRERLIADLRERLRPGDLLGAVGFARRAEVVEWPGSPPRRPTFSAAGIDPSATRLAAGIEAAVPLCPEHTARKVVLVTDGNETIGDARRAAALARQTDVALYALVPGAGATGGFSFEKLVAPPLVRE
ncbi:MAG: hypothetical protein ACREQY_23480, partial [Candidatus Binatia bacterium]